MKLEKQLINLIKTASRRPEATDLTAKVLRIEGQTAWVHFDGGAEETPVEMSISCEPGDDVRVRINKGAAYIIGNNTNPPTNDRIIVKYAANLAQAAREVANRAYKNLQELLQTYVNKGSSNIDVLSTAMSQDENGTNVYGDISTAGDHYVKVNESGMDVRRVAVGGQTAETDPVTAHIGTDYVALGERAEGEIGEGSYSEGKDILNSGKYSHVEGYENQIKPRSGETGRETAAHVEGYQTYIQAVRSNSARRRGNHVEGYKSYIGDRNDTSSGASYIDGAHVEGRYTSVNSHAGHAEGSYSWVTGESGHAEGNGTEAAGLESHAEGSNTKASGLAAHTEGAGYSHGDGGVASGNYSHHENYDNVASGNSSHASGYRTKASGNRAATFGSFTQASHTDQFAIGRDNVDKDDTYFEIGNGASTSYRGQGTPANVFEITRSGYLRTGQGMTDIGFGKESGNMGYYEPGSSGAVFTPWVPLVNGKIPETFLPSYVDDVIEGYYNSTDGKFYEESTYQTEIAGERGKIYISLDTDKSYRWSRTVFVELTSGGVVYSAGSGIDISGTNEISADNTIARMTDLSGYLPLAGGTMTGAINSQHIVPATDDSYRLGSSSSKYNSAYIKRIYNLASIESTTDGSKRLLVPAKSGTIAVNEDLPEVVKNLIAVNPILTSGALIANITISGVAKNIYSPVPDWAQTVSTEPDYIKNKPAIPSKTSDLTNNSGFITLYDIPPIPSRTSDLTNDSGFITINDIPTIPDELADLEDDSTHRLVTDTEKSTWNGKSDFSGSYNDLSDKPTIPAAQVNSDWNATSGVARILNKPTIPSVPVTIQNGGTGGTTVAAARANLDVLKTVLYGGYYPSSQTAGWYTIFEFPHRTMTLAILQIISEEYENSSAIVFINGRYAQQGTTWASQSPEVTLFGNVDYGTAGGYTKFRITQNGGQGRLALDIYANGRGANLRIKVLYCDVTDYNVYSTLTPAVYSTVLREVQRNFLDSIETTGNLSLRDSIYMRGYTRAGAYIHTGSTPKNAESWSEFLDNSGIDAEEGINICQGINETSGIHMDGNTIVMWSPCDDGALWYYDEDEGDPVFHIDDTGTYYNKSGISYLPLSGGTMNAGAKITFTNSATEDGIYLNNGSYQLRLIIGSDGVKRGLWDGSRWMIYEDATNVTLQSPGSLILNNNTVINHTEGNWNSGLRINSVAGNANGSANITFGGPSGSYTGTNDSYPMYQIGKTSSKSGAFFLNSRISGVERVLMYGHNAGLQFYSFDQTKQVDIQNDGIRTRTNKLYLHGKDNNYSDGSGEPSSPLILDGFESGQITANSSENTNVNIASTGDELVLVFLSAASGNSFYAVRLLRNNNGTLQTINLASNGTSIATISLNANQTNYITIKNTSSSYRLYYKILKLG